MLGGKVCSWKSSVSLRIWMFLKPETEGGETIGKAISGCETERHLYQYNSNLDTMIVNDF